MLYLHMGKKVEIISFSQQNFSMIVLSLHKSHFSYWADAGITIISALISFSGWKEWTKKSGGKRQLEVEYFYFPQSETQRNIMSLREQERGKHTLSGLQMAKLLADSLPHQFILETVKLLYQKFNSSPFWCLNLYNTSFNWMWEGAFRRAAIFGTTA